VTAFQLNVTEVLVTFVHDTTGAGSVGSTTTVTVSLKVQPKPFLILDIWQTKLILEQ
jgi:hypothetical protein